MLGKKNTLSLKFAFVVCELEVGHSLEDKTCSLNAVWLWKNAYKQRKFIVYTAVENMCQISDTKRGGQLIVLGLAVTREMFRADSYDITGSDVRKVRLVPEKNSSVVWWVCCLYNLTGCICYLQNISERRRKWQIKCKCWQWVFLHIGWSDLSLMTLRFSSH